MTRHALHPTTAVRCGAVWLALRSVVHRALHVYANGTRMHNRSVCARVYYNNMYMAPHCGCVHPGCRLCGAYAVAVGVITHELVVACSACAWALLLRVDVITRRKGVCTYAWARCRYGIYNPGCRRSARRVSDAASVHGIVRKHDCALPTLYPKLATRGGQ